MVEYYQVEIADKPYDTDEQESVIEARNARIESELEMIEKNKWLGPDLRKRESGSVASKNLNSSKKDRDNQPKPSTRSEKKPGAVKKQAVEARKKSEFGVKV